MRKIILEMLLFLSIFNSQAQTGKLNVGDTAINFTVTDTKGQIHTLFNYTDSGKYVLIDFFSYACSGCRTKALIVNTFYHKYGCNQHEVIVLGIDGEGTNEDIAWFDSISGLSEDHYPEVSGIDGNGQSVIAEYGIYGTPTLLAISPNRIILNLGINPSDNAPEILAAFPENSIFPHLCEPNTIVENESKHYHLYPNPTSDKITIHSLSKSQFTSYSIADITGKIIVNKKQAQVNFELNLSNLANGLYLIQIDDEWNTKIKVFKSGN